MNNYSLRIELRTNRILQIAVGSLVLITVLLSSPVDFYADNNLTLHMFQHIGLFVTSAFFGYSLDRMLISRLTWLKNTTYSGWRTFVAVMKFNTRTKGLVFSGLMPSVAFFYWSLPQYFDLAVVNENVHILEHLTYIVVGTFVGASINAIPRRLRAFLLLFGFMMIGMMGSMMVVWPYFYNVFSAAQNTQMDTVMMLFGAFGLIGTSSWLLKVLDVL